MGASYMPQGRSGGATGGAARPSTTSPFPAMQIPSAPSYTPSAALMGKPIPQWIPPEVLQRQALEAYKANQARNFTTVGNGQGQTVQPRTEVPAFLRTQYLR